MRFLMEGWSCYSFFSNNDAIGSAAIIYNILPVGCRTLWGALLGEPYMQVKMLPIACFVAVSDQPKLLHAQALISGSLAELFGNYYG